MTAKFVKLGPNRRYPSLPDSDGTAESVAEQVRMIKEALEVGERRTGDIRDSFCRIRDLQEMGLIKVDGESGIVVDSDDDTLYTRRDLEEEITASWRFREKDLRFTSGYGITAERLDGGSGNCLIDLNVVDDGVTTSNLCLVRLHRGTNTAGTSGVYGYRGDGTTNLAYAFLYDNNAALGTIEARNATRFRAYSTSNAKMLDIYHNNTNAKYVLASGDGAHSFEVNSTNVFSIDTNDVRVVNGKTFKVTDVAENDSIGLLHDGTDGIVGLIDKATDPSGILIQPFAGTSDNSGIYTTRTLICNDDDTVTITLPKGMDGGFVFLVAQTTSSAETGQHGAVFYFSNTTMIPLFTHTNWSFGSGSNPNVDTDHNVWRSGEATISIKNRRGSSRYYNAFIICGE